MQNSYKNNVIRVPLADTQSNRSYLNDKDFLLLNAFVEKREQGTKIRKRPGWNKKTTVSLSDARGFTYNKTHNLFYAVFGDGLYSITADLTTVTDIIRKTPTSVTWGAAAGGTFTFVFAAAHGFIVGQQVKSSGISPAAYSAVLTVAAVTTTTVANDTFTVTGVGADPGASSGATKRVSPIITGSGKVFFELSSNAGSQVTMLQFPVTTALPSQLFMIGSSSVVTKVTDADYPLTALGSIISIDGYLFAFAEVSGGSGHAIYNADLEAPTSFNSLNYTSAEMFPDHGVTIAKYNNMLVCFKEYSTEFFYNAANATGSPLSRIVERALSIGCVSANTVVQIQDKLLWISRNQNGGLSAHQLAGGGLTKVSTTPIDKILASVESVVFSETVNSFYLSYEGHDFFVTSFEGTQGSNQAIAGIAVAGIAIAGLGTGLSYFKRTLVYDVTEGLWHEWSSLDSTTGQQTSFFGSFPVSGPHVANSQDYTNTVILDKSTGDIYEMSPAPIGSSVANTYKDGTNAITTKLVTNNLDFGTRNRKSMARLEVIGDRPSTTSNLTIRWSDDDYKTWNTGRTVDLQNRSYISNLGMSRLRAFELVHVADTDLRLEALDIEFKDMDS